MTDRKKKFTGPLFIVGMSRSGTSLLRGVLNRSPEIGIPPYESHFIPYLIHRFRNKTFPLEQKLAMEVRCIIKNSIFLYVFRSQGLLIKDSELDHILQLESLEGIIEALMRFFIISNTKTPAFIWGDKSPKSLLSIGLLKSFFPNARIIHIIRDPRDRALSSNKAWGANLYIAAERWRKGIGIARQQGQTLGNDYLEIFYEKFTTNPKKTIEQLCNFLDINYNESMLVLEHPVEKHAEIDAVTRNTKKIVSGNTKKYIHELKANQIKRIDEIVFPIAKVLDYNPVYPETTYVPFTGLQKLAGIIDDSFNAIIWHIRRYGIKTGIKHLRWRSRITIQDNFPESDESPGI